MISRATIRGMGVNELLPLLTVNHEIVYIYISVCVSLNNYYGFVKFSIYLYLFLKVLRATVTQLDVHKHQSLLNTLSVQISPNTLNLLQN